MLLPALYLSRVGAEYLLAVAPGVGAALGFIIGSGGAFWLKRRNASPGWGTLLLLPYVLFPYQSPPLALACGLVALTLWGVAHWRHHGWLNEGTVFIVALVLYGATLAPGVQPADGGEFQLVIAEWGVAHPPGYPLYTMLGAVFARIFPFGGMADRVNLFSALIAALTLALLCRAVRQEAGLGWAGVLAAGILGTAMTFWTTATQASIRPMTALFTVLMIEAALSYRRACRSGDASQAQGALLRFGAATGLGITHHPSLLFPGSVLAVALVAAAPPSRHRRARDWGLALLAALLGALPWGYLLLRGASGARLAPSNLATWEGFWQHVLARGFAGDMFYYRTWADLSERLRLITQVLAFQWHGLLLALGMLALLLLLWRDRWLLLTLGGAFGLHTLVAATYRAPQTVEYMIPAYVCLAAGVGWAAAQAWQVARGHPVSALPAALAVVGVMWSGWPVWISLHAYQQHDSTGETARALLQAAPPESLVLANWHQATPLWLVQQVEGLRPDVDVQYVAPAGAEPILDTWARLIASYADERPLIVCSYYPEVYRHTGRTFSSLESCWQARALPPPSTEAEAPLSLHGEFALFVEDLPTPTPAGGRAYVTLRWQMPRPVTYGEATTFVHVVDAGGRVLAQDDQPIIAPDLAGPGTISQRYTLLIPRTAPPGVYRLLAGLYLQTPDGPQAVHNAQGEDRTQLGELRIHTARLPPVTSRALWVPWGENLLLAGYDYDLSVPGRARLYLHWQVLSPSAGQPLTLSVRAGSRELARGELSVAEPGYLTTAHDLPDTETVNGLRVTVEAEGEALRAGGAWGLPLGSSVALDGPVPGERYIMVGDVVVVGYAVAPLPEPAEGVVVLLTMRSMSALTQDITFQLAHGTAAQANSPPAGGTIPTLKWGWGTTIRDRLILQYPSEAPAPPDRPLTLTLYDAFTSQVWPVFDPVLGQGVGLPLTP